LIIQRKNNKNIDGNIDYDVEVINNLLTKDECDQLIHLAKTKNMTDSHVVSDDKVNEYDSKSRKSKQCWMSAATNPVLKKLSKVSEDLTGFPFLNQELVQIVKYDQGGKFDAHYDSCVKNKKICDEMNRGAGERRSTLLVYLNDDMEGGETEFVKKNLKIKPEKGKGILFYSTDNNDNLIKDSMHRGCPVEKGEKWIATIWSHPQPFL
jgi:prolyl 4-hydroxylase